MTLVVPSRRPDGPLIFPRLAPMPTDTFFDAPVRVYSYLHYYKLLNLIVKRQLYDDLPGTAFPTARLNHPPYLYGELQLRPPNADPDALLPDAREAELREAMQQVRAAVTDLDADVIDILVALWLRHHRRPNRHVFVDTDDVLAARGLRHKVNGQQTNAHATGRGYTPKQRAAVNAALRRLRCIWLTIAARPYRGSEPFEKQGRAFSLELESGKMADADPKKRWRFRFMPGGVFRYYGASQHMVVLPKLFNYRPRRQRWEKRLARYLFWQWRVDARRNLEGFRRSIGALLETVVVDLDARRFQLVEPANEGNVRRRSEQPAPLARPHYRIRERLEQALTRLEADGVVGHWTYAAGWDPAWSRRRDWYKRWTQAQVHIAPPPSVVEAYASIESGAAKAASRQAFEASSSDGEAPSLGQAVAACRRLLQLKQEEVARQIPGLSQSYLSQIERGRRPSPELARKLKRWLMESHEEMHSKL